MLHQQLRQIRGEREAGTLFWAASAEPAEPNMAMFGLGGLAHCKKNGAGTRLGGVGFCGFTGSTSSQAKPQLHLLTCYSMEPLHFLSVW